MATGHEVIGVSTVAASIIQGRLDRHNSGSIDRSIVLQNRSVLTIFLGGEDVSVSDFGYALVPNGEISFDLITSDDLFVVASGNVDLNVLYLGL